MTHSVAQAGLNFEDLLLYLPNIEIKYTSMLSHD